MALEHTTEVLDAIGQRRKPLHGSFLSILTHSRLWRTAASWSSLKVDLVVARISGSHRGRTEMDEIADIFMERLEEDCDVIDENNPLFCKFYCLYSCRVRESMVL